MPSLMDWMYVTLMLTRAMLGEVSPNMRMISLDFHESSWNVKVYLESDDDQDRESIDEIVSEFAIYMEDIRDSISQESYGRINSSVIISNGQLNISESENSRIIFRRRE